MNAIVNYITLNTKPLEMVTYNIDNKLWQLNVCNKKNAEIINKRVENLKDYSNMKKMLNL